MTDKVDSLIDNPLIRSSHGYEAGLITQSLVTVMDYQSVCVFGVSPLFNKYNSVTSRHTLRIICIIGTKSENLISSCFA